MNPDTLIESIAAGADLWVVLENRFGDTPYVESYELTNIVMTAGKFWGKFRNVHSSEGLHGMFGDVVDGYSASAFAYNNFAPVVCTINLSRESARFFSARAYKTKVFRTRGNFHPIWHSRTGWHSKTGDAPTAMERAVRGGRRMKLKLVADGFTYLMPLHVVEVRHDGRFAAYTEMDGYPELLRLPERAEHLGQQLEEANATPGVRYASSGFGSHPFWHTCFHLTEAGVVTKAGEEFACDEASILAEGRAP